MRRKWMISRLEAAGPDWERTIKCPHYLDRRNLSIESFIKRLVIPFDVFLFYYHVSFAIEAHLHVQCKTHSLSFVDGKGLQSIESQPTESQPTRWKSSPPELQWRNCWWCWWRPHGYCWQQENRVRHMEREKDMVKADGFRIVQIVGDQAVEGQIMKE